VFVNYLIIFSPPTLPLGSRQHGNTKPRVRFGIESECCGYKDRFRLWLYCMSHINLSETNGRHARSTIVNLDSNR
jgi:hypothetical protein